MEISVDYHPLPDDTYGVKPYSSRVALAMTLNYIIGTGCFGLPYAFTEAGIALALLLLALGTGLALISMNYTLEVLARADGVTHAKPGEMPVHQMTYEKFDFARVAGIFAGRPGRITLQTCIMCYGLGTLWSYASVFASSAASLFFSYAGEGGGHGGGRGTCNVYADNASTACLNGYYISMGVFAIVVVTLVLMNLADQTRIQNFLTIYRIVALIIMITTLLIKVTADGHDVVSARMRNIGLFNWSKFAKGFGPTLLAITCQYNMPDALQPLDVKEEARWATFSALLLSSAFYVLLATLGALGFDEVNPLVSLNWAEYTACGSGWEECGLNKHGEDKQKTIATLVQLLVLLFPLLNVTSAYPMIGITMGENISMSIPDSIKNRSGVKATNSLARLCCCIPPLLLAAAFKKLDFILTVAGLIGFVLSLIIPCYLEEASLKFCLHTWGSSAVATPYHSATFSNLNAAKTLMYFSSALTVVAVVTLFV